MLTRNLAQQLGPAGIRVNSIAPSAIRNQRIELNMNHQQQTDLVRQAIQRVGEPQDVAAATLFLCSKSASWITDITLHIAGGKVML